MSVPAALEEQRPPKAFSCIRCFDRKVKCDKQSPCSNCVKSKVECIFRVPSAPRRRKKRTQDDILLARLKKCEDLLKSKGLDIDDPDTLTRTATSSSNVESPSRTQSISQIGSPDVSNNTDNIYRPAFASPEIRRTGRLIKDQGKSRFIENNLWASLSDEVSKMQLHCLPPPFFDLLWLRETTHSIHPLSISRGRVASLQSSCSSSSLDTD